MRADSLIPELVDAEFWEFAPDALPELLGVLGLGFVLGEVVDVDVAGGGLVRRETGMVEGERVRYKPPRRPLSRGSTNSEYAGLRTPVGGLT